jgi:hypothetical protein
LPRASPRSDAADTDQTVRITIAAARYRWPRAELIKDRFVCDPRGVISVKGKGAMEAYILVSRRGGARSSHGV